MVESADEHVTPEPPLRLARSLVLVGLMGAGKSAVGRRAAHRLHVPFVDVDAEIELAANATIAEIWEREGEAVFRAGERRVLARLLDGPVAVLASGGGAFVDPENRARIRASGFSVWIKADLETLVQRTARRRTRPLLNTDDPRDVLARLIEVRYPIYAEADITVDSQPGPVDATVRSLLDALAAQAGPDGTVGIPPDPPGF